MIYTILVKDESGQATHILSFSSITQFGESWSGTVAKSTVENGFPVADHITVENPVFNINGILTSYSIFDNNREIVWNGEDFELPSGQGDVNYNHLIVKRDMIHLLKSGEVITLLETETNSFASNAQQRYEEIKAKQFSEYDNCVITSLKFDVNENTQDSAFFVSMQIEQLNIARTETTQLSEEEMQKAIVPKVAKQSTNVGASSQTTSTDGTGTPEKNTDVSAQKATVKDIPEDARVQMEANKAEREAIEHAKGLKRIDPSSDYEISDIDGGVVVERRPRF